MIEFQSLIVFVASFFGNMGNYKSFGDTKFIPGLAKVHT
jgi:dipeptidyl-peptidase-3